MAEVAGETDTHWIVEWTLVFRDMPDRLERGWFWRLLKPGFQHVECWRQYEHIWIRIEPCMELLATEAYPLPPEQLVPPELNPTFVKVRRCVPKGQLRERFFFGPWTCVEIAKATIGLCAPTVRTPYQLFKRIRRDVKTQAEQGTEGSGAGSSGTAGNPDGGPRSVE